MTLTNLIDTDTKKTLLLAMPNLVGLLICVYLLWSINTTLYADNQALQAQVTACLVRNITAQPWPIP